jgi:hypothetical protein
LGAIRCCALNVNGSVVSRVKVNDTANACWVFARETRHLLASCGCSDQVNARQTLGVKKGEDVLDERRLIVSTVRHIGFAVPASGECKNAKVVGQVLS